jgi:hypothetical protein
MDHGSFELQPPLLEAVHSLLLAVCQGGAGAVGRHGSLQLALPFILLRLGVRYPRYHTPLSKIGGIRGRG